MTDKINNINNERLKAKLLAKFNDHSSRLDVLDYISHWARISINLRILFSVFSLGLTPLIYLIWAKLTHQHHLNWVTKPSVDSLAAISEINNMTEPNIETAQDPDENQAEHHPSEERNDNKDPEVSPKEEDTTETEDILMVRKKDLKTEKYFIGTQKGFLYIVKDGKFEKHDFMNGPIINVDFTDITEGENNCRLALISHKNGCVNAYNMDDFTKTLFVLHVEKWINEKNNTVVFDKDGNIRAQSPERDVVIWDRTRIIDQLFPAPASLAELVGKERSKLTPSMDLSAHPEEALPCRLEG